MSTNGSDASGNKSGRSLKTALSKARLIQAERNDAVADLRAAEKARLDMLAEEVAPVFNEIPNGYDFEGVVSAGTRPRFWVDMLAFVAMADDKRTYRFLKDTRLGREVIFESDDVNLVADQVTEYLAYRVLERDKALDEQERGVERKTLQEKPAQSKKVDEFGDEVEEDTAEKVRFEEEEATEVSVSGERRGFSFGTLLLGLLLGAGGCFVILAAAGLGYIKL